MQRVLLSFYLPSPIKNDIRDQICQYLCLYFTFFQPRPSPQSVVCLSSVNHARTGTLEKKGANCSWMFVKIRISSGLNKQTLKCKADQREGQFCLSEILG